MKYLAILFVATILASCGQKPIVKETPKLAPVAAAPFEKFSFRMSASGIPSANKPYDMWVMDTNQAMGVHTTKRGSNGKYREINALAQLDPPDYDTLRQLIVKGKLYLIDSADVTQACAEDELYQVDIVPLAAIKPVRLAFSACAKDYNLLLQPQREYFAKLIDWFERMRVKYRPEQPD